ncbi:unnamed protein product [Ambrosiozyma monospora]|uniref:Unnamed protein product n=1 Tax=Ambrosiozyma monospora TaxID=43982 RepID=A0A9W6Z4B2_AMBMO|nr:unnamed protein product [Ambrosiozyma monospora]
MCTYDYTSNVLSHIPSVLFGKVKPTGKVPGENKKDDYMDDIFDMSPSTVSGGSPMNKSLEFLLNDSVRSPHATEQAMSQSVSNKKLLTDSALQSVSGSPVDDLHRMKRKKLNKPWLIEKFDFNRDFANLLILIKNSLSTKDVFPLTSRYTARLHQLLEFSQDQTHFIVRNSTLNVIYGVCLTWSEHGSEVGHILYILVDKSKRRQSIGEMLHNHAIKYLRQDRNCKVIHLGSDFPMLSFFKEHRLDEVYTFWSNIETSANNDTKLLNQEDPMSGVLNFTKNVGWADVKNYKKKYTQTKKFILVLEIKNWKLSEKLVKQLTVVGVKFEICTDYNEILSILKTNEFQDLEEKRYEQIYIEAGKYIKEEREDKSAKKFSNNIMILKAFEPTSKSTLGSCILFNTSSKFTLYYPFMDNINSPVSEPVYGLTGLFVDSNYEPLKPALKLGLVCTGVSFVKKLKGSKLLTGNFDESHLGELTESGFKVYGEYCSAFGVRRSYEWSL